VVGALVARELYWGYGGAYSDLVVILEDPFGTLQGIMACMVSSLHKVACQGLVRYQQFWVKRESTQYEAQCLPPVKGSIYL